MRRLREFIEKHSVEIEIAIKFTVLVIIVGAITLLPFEIHCLLCTYTNICPNIKTVVIAWLLWLPIAVLVCRKTLDRIVE